MHFKRNYTFGGVLASSVAVLLATTSLNAIPRDPCETPPPAVCCEEPKPGPFAFSYPFDMDLNCPRDFYFYVDGLAMQAKEDGLDFAINNESTPQGGAAISGGIVEGFSGNNRDFDYNPGIRVGLGFYLDHDAWSVDFDWTWLNITNYQKANADNNLGGMLPLWALGDGTPANQIGAHSSAKWDARYNTFDISLGKPHYVSRYLIMNPFFGFRGGWIYQNFSADYGGLATSGHGVTTRTISKNENDFWGIGARAGLNSNWVIGKGWSLIGNIAASMIYGKFEIDQSYTLPGAGTEGYKVKYDFYQNVPNFEIALGISWGYYFNKKRNHVAVRAAYEFHEWWDQLNLRKFSSGGAGTPTSGTNTVSTGIYTNDVVSRGNLTLNGFSLRVQFDI